MGFNSGLTIELPGGSTAGGTEWNGNTTLYTFIDGDTTPDVSSGMAFITANTGATIISDFDHSGANKYVTILVGDNNTTFVHNTAKLWLEGTSNLTTNTGDTLKFYYDGTRWRLTDISLVYH